VNARFEERGLPNYPSGIPFLFWEQYLSLRGNLGLALAAGFGAVALTVLILLFNVWGAVLIAFSLAGCALQTLGLLGILGIPLSAVTAVLTVLGVGIAAQPCLHITLVSNQTSLCVTRTRI
jgi:patched 1 protein